MRLYIASDHAGFDLKQHLVSYLEEHGVEVVDKGPHSFTPGDDYPDWISLVGQEISENPNARGVVIGLSGQGEALVANKFKRVRAGVYYGGPPEIPKLLREHNNANVLSLGAKFVSKEDAERAVDVFIETQFSEDARHIRRIQKITKIENPE
ncbi:MAG: ribose-5-phosphate isomerase ribose 5-phosphate isomerase [Candidatus Paceibacter sp.]|jgi:ribose 5-phosphate isomerase B|nr:ribose-5-phosphate isomerase ribose 5-phosphate isomerase [Candidatus Paceibacter sp.]